VDWGDQGTAYITVIETTADQYACTQTDTFSVTVFPNPNPVISGTNTLCEGDSGIIYVTPYTPDNQYSWSMVPDNLGDIISTDSNMISVNWNQDGTTRLYVTEVTSIGCHNSGSFDVTVNPKPVPWISGINSVCETDTVLYQTPYNNGDVYTWELTPSGIGEIISPADSNQLMIHWLQPGNAWLSVGEVVTATTCANTAPGFPVVINPNPDILALSPVLEICDGDSVMVTLRGADEYHWNPVTGLIPVSDSTWILKPTDTTCYSITGINRLSGCYDSIHYTLMVKPNPVFDLGENQFLYPDHPVVIHAGSGFDNYQWNTGDTDSILLITEPGGYWVEVTLFGCSSTDSISVKIPLAYMPVPNAFTPNNDGINDKFKVVGTLDEVVKFNMQIYNRWGRLIYETNDILNNGWDGTYNGSPCPVDTYIWIITFEEKHDPAHVPLTRRGTVSLLK
jgi:gliding motility-associated-like protein